MNRPPDERAMTPEVLQTLVDNHREFLAFVERRIGDRTAAEDLLQDAFVRGMEKGGELRSDESARAWFYRLLRNAIVDRHRRDAARGRQLDAFAAELATAEQDKAGEADRAICACVERLVETIKPEYARALRRIELDGLAVVDFAREAGISESNAGVRVFRARQSLRQQVAKSCGTCAEHGCVDCTCKQP
ncbi:MAG: sigma-70 family RNA polymerase sigma factor [Planctomycetota bacterium]